VAVVVIGIVRTIRLGRQFERHVKERHPQEWTRIFEDQLLRKSLLWIFMKDTPSGFHVDLSGGFRRPADLRPQNPCSP